MEQDILPTAPNRFFFRALVLFVRFRVGCMFLSNPLVLVRVFSVFRG
jgi:hypothetical protein